jgi:hypothetical protein
MSGVNQLSHRLVLILVFGILASFAVGMRAFAQAGSTGGTIGKMDKSVSGEKEAPRKIRSTKKSSPRADTGSSSRRGGRDGGVARYDGTWTATASPGCKSSGTISITVSGGRINDPLLSGTVSQTGAFHTVGVGGAVGTGRITGNTGSGTYREPNGCSGSISAIKN